MTRTSLLLTLVALSLLGGCDKGDGDHVEHDATTDAQEDTGTDAATSMPMFYGIDSLDRLVRFSPASMDAASSMSITGLSPSETVLSLDVRPSNGLLYAFTSMSRLYTINTSTGAATPVGAPLASALSGLRMGIDINPVVDRLRVVTIAQQNVRVNPIDGMLVMTDGTLAFASGDPNMGAAPHIGDVAYTNNVVGSATTTLFGIDTQLDVLVLFNPPNPGTGNTVGALGVDATEVGFDIVTGSSGDTAYAAISVGAAMTSSLYTINLSTGAATSLGAIGGNALHALAYMP